MTDAFRAGTRRGTDGVARGPRGVGDNGTAPGDGQTALDLLGPAGVWVKTGIESCRKRFDSVTDRAEDWARGKEADFLEEVQIGLDAITEKARQHAKEEITFREKALLRSVYYGMVVGGWLRDWPEASALMLHYLGKSGGPLEIDSGIYERSTRVQKEMKRQKKRAAAELQQGRTVFRDKSPPLFADYNRLKYADHRFFLKSVTRRGSRKNCVTTWRVDNQYRFEDFRGTDATWWKVSKWSEFPLRGRRIRIYDGLSRYLVQLGMAAEFDYWATWQEEWPLNGTE